MKKITEFIDQFSGAKQESFTDYHGNIDDNEAARAFGVRLKVEYDYWSWKACAIANVAMILKNEGKLKESLYDLICEAQLMNGYAFKNIRGKKDIGWKHKALIEMLGKRGLRSEKKKNIEFKDLTRLKKKPVYFIASIKSKNGSHMVLITDVNDEKVVYHDPYIFKGHGGPNISQDISSFRDVFLKKGILVWPS